MSQPRRHSLLEQSLNTASGFVISYFMSMFLWHRLGVPISNAQNTIVVAVLTVVSVLRGYVWRRVFNWIQWKEL